MRSEAVPWWRQAQADLQSRDLVLHSGHFYAAAWFARQAAEKACKALWAEQRGGTLPPRTHDLYFLDMEVAASPPVLSDLALLYPVFALARYPDIDGTAPVDAIGGADARIYRAGAERILQWVGSQL